MACTFILFGATGDLAKKKLIPALSHLYGKGQLDETRIIAIGRRDYDDARIRKEYAPHCDGAKDFLERVSYHRLEFHDRSAYESLLEKVNGLPAAVRDNRLFYLATPQKAFGDIVEHLSATGLAAAKPAQGWHRVVFEKPFGSDLKSAHELNGHITKLFREEQIYRIDHYVGKSLVQEILVLRFANPVFESVWNNRHVDRIDIIVSEKDGVGTRGEYYDTAGALRDMVQNHLLQLLSLATMEAPMSLKAEDIREEKAKVLKAIDVSNAKLLLGQYEGYTKEEGVRMDSTTETFAAAELALSTERWKDIPCYLVTGKGLEERYAEIVVHFANDYCTLFHDDGQECAENVLIISIQPEEGVQFLFNLADEVGSSVVKPQLMDYRHGTAGLNTPDAYELLLTEIMEGDQTLFTRWDFVEESWRIVDELRSKQGKLLTYPQGVHMPQGMREFLDEEHHIWRKDAERLN